MIKNNDRNVLNYFSMQKAYGVIHFATYKEIIIEVNGLEQSRVYTLAENTMSYKATANLCSMPVNFLFNLLVRSDNPEWTMAVIDLLLEEQNTDLVLMIQDQINKEVFTQNKTYRFVHKTYEDKYTGRGYDDRGIPKTPSFNGTSFKGYTWPAGGSVQEKVVRTTYTNTTTVFVKNAHTWCLDFEQEAAPNNTETPRRRYTNRRNLYRIRFCIIRLS